MAGGRQRLGRLGANRSFARSVVVLASGTAGGQAIAIVVAPFLSRLYTPSEFGTFGVYLAVVSIIAVAASLRYESALPLPADDSEAVDLMAVSFLITLALSLVITIGLFVVGGVLSPAVPATLRPLLWLMPIGILLTGIQQVLTFWAIRRQAFGASGQSSIIQGATQAASQIALGLLSASSLGLAIGYVLARVGGVVRLLPTVEGAHWRALRGLSPRRLRAVAGAYRRFPLFALWSSLLSNISLQTPILVLAALFNATIVGWFSITVRVLQLPSNVIGLAVGQVFYARVSQSDAADLARTSSALFRSLVALSAGPMWLLAFGGQYAFALVFGDAWQGAGLYAQLLAPWLLLDFVTSPLSPLAYVRNRQPALVAFQGLLLGSRIGALVAGAALGGADLAMVCYAVTSTVLVGAYLVWLLRVGGVGTRAPMLCLARELAIGLVLSLPLLALTVLVVPAVAWLAVAVASLAIMVLRAVRLTARAMRENDGGPAPSAEAALGPSTAPR